MGMTPDHSFIYLFTYWLCCVFIAAWLSSSCVEPGLLSLRLCCAGFSAVASVVEHGPESVGSVVVALVHGCSPACGIVLDQGSNL